jgi:AraC-like ligand binding domain
MSGEPITSLGFAPPDPRVPGFEITELASLHERMRRRRPGELHRVDFHTLTLVTEGTGTRTVDFVTYPCRPGTLLWVRPGQVQRYGDLGTSNGMHLMCTPAFPPVFSGAEHLVSEWYGPVCWQLDTSLDYAVLATLLSQLRAEFGRAPGTVSPEILQLLLAALLLHVDRLPKRGQGGDPRAGGEIYARFRAELERSYSTVRRAEDYAQCLGYTVKTLTRACLAVTGRRSRTSSTAASPWRRSGCSPTPTSRSRPSPGGSGSANPPTSASSSPAGPAPRRANSAASPRELRH